MSGCVHPSQVSVLELLTSWKRVPHLIASSPRVTHNTPISSSVYNAQLIKQISHHSMKLTHSVLYSVVLAIAAQAVVVPDLGSESSKDAPSPYAPVMVDVSPQENAVNVVSHTISDVFSPILKAAESLIPHKYIVVYKDGVSDEDIDTHRSHIHEHQSMALEALRALDPGHKFFDMVRAAGLEGVADGIQHTFDGVLSGFAGYFLDSTVELLRKSPHVAFVEQDSIVHALDIATQNGAPWGLARVSHREKLSLGSFNKYLYDSEGGEGVISYVIDTGVLDTHEEFEGRAKLIADIPNDGALDGNGHGTHCSGTIIGKTYGVAKKAHLRGVKVLGANGSGSMSDVVKGVEVATKDYLAEVKKGRKGFKGSSGNMSLGGGKSPALDLAVNGAVKNGIIMAVAAGNENQDACNTSPARADLPITVGASTISDARAYFSNYGKCVDIFAPGLNILSTYIGSNTATATLSGTSMASPHVAGLAAYYLSLAPESSSEFSSSSAVTAASIKKNLIDFGTKNVLTDVGEGSPNVLAFNGAGEELPFW